jgi:large subunit ribosomal protein L6
MSRIGKKPITLPAAVEVAVEGNAVNVKGPKGTLQIKLHPHVSAKVESDPKSIVISVADENNVSDRALWGLSRQLIANAVEGVQKPFEKSLEFIGVGFKVNQAGTNKLNIEVGFSHPVEFTLPAGIESKVEKQVVTLTGIDKQLVGETAARIRRIKPPEPYKGKGIKYTTETIRRKAGKAATKGA